MSSRNGKNVADSKLNYSEQYCTSEEPYPFEQDDAVNSLPLQEYYQCYLDEILYNYSMYGVDKYSPNYTQTCTNNIANTQLNEKFNLNISITITTAEWGRIILYQQLWIFYPTDHLQMIYSNSFMAIIQLVHIHPDLLPF
jgi:hypothetical protein